MNGRNNVCNDNQVASREECRRLDNRMIYIIQLRWPYDRNHRGAKLVSNKGKSPDSAASLL